MAWLSVVVGHASHLGPIVGVDNELVPGHGQPVVGTNATPPSVR